MSPQEQRVLELAPEIDSDSWLNTSQPISIAAQRGKVTVIHAFQMLCPGCVTHGIPQASAIYDLYQRAQVTVIGLHSVFEHHEVMNQEALKAFVHEYRLQFPIAIDRPVANDRIPSTMRRYALRGTPSLVLIDRKGYVRLNYFGRLSDMQAGNLIGQLVGEVIKVAGEESKEDPESGERSDCSADRCGL